MSFTQTRRLAGLPTSLLRRLFGSSNRTSIFVPRSSLNVTDKFVVQARPSHKKHPDVRQMVKKMTKKSKKDTKDSTSRANILFYEIQEALLKYKEKFGKSLSVSQVTIQPELLEVFLFTRNRPLVEIPSVEIIYQTSEGHGLAIIPQSLYATPFVENQSDIFNSYTVIQVPKSIVGDKVSVKLLTHHDYCCESEMLEIVKPSPKRNQQLIICDKFESCTGCQFQMLPYEEQLEHKSSIISRAYKFFYPNLEKEHPHLDSFGVVTGSSMQYAYRNKLTPHYKRNKHYVEGKFDIGFVHPNPTKGITDIDYCPITSPTINQSLQHYKRKQFEIEAAKEYNPRSNLGGLNLRESILVNAETGSYRNICLEGGKKIITTRVEDKIFQYESDLFFQINTSILPLVFDFIRYHLKQSDTKLQYLIDSYCGVGLFSICLANDFSGKVFGIEIDSNSIKYATKNAKLNGLKVPDKIQFIDGDAETMFSSPEFVNSGIVGEQSVVIMDPSRKGSTNLFLKQLVQLKPKMVVYVSCNVFTQARDLSAFNTFLKAQNLNYVVKDIVGFDFFPQTRHVETVAILELQE